MVDFCARSRRSLSGLGIRQRDCRRFLGPRAAKKKQGESSRTMPPAHGVANALRARFTSLPAESSCPEKRVYSAVEELESRELRLRIPPLKRLARHAGVPVECVAAAAGTSGTSPRMAAR